MTSDKIKAAAHARGLAKSAKTEEKIRAAQSLIVQEMKENGGIYPCNGGALSKNEVARRAGINSTTFHTPAQKELGKEIKAWIESLRKKEVVGRMQIRRGLAERLEEAKKLYDGLEQSHIEELRSLQQARAELCVSEQKIEELIKENEKLKRLLENSTKGKITALPKRN